MAVMTDIALEPETSAGRQAGFESRPNAAIAARAAGVPVLDVVIPVYNEQATLADSVYRLHRHLREQFPFPARITIADNASVDDTPRLAEELAAELSDVRVVRLEQKGRGRALHEAWSDVRRAGARLHGRRPVHRPRGAGSRSSRRSSPGTRDLAIGTRLSRGARVVRGSKREIISRCYNLILKSTLAAGFSDAQCGFKAIRADVAQRLLPHITDTGWFFDTELLVLAERSGLRIHEVPVDWVDDPDSRVDIVATATADLRGIARLLRGFAKGSIPVQTLTAQLGSSREDARTGSLLRQDGAVRQRRGRVARPLISCCSCCCTGGSAPRRRIYWRFSSPPSATPPPTAASPSESPVAVARPAIISKDSSCSASRWPSPAVRWPCCTPSSPHRAATSSDCSGGGEPARHRRPFRPAPRLGVPPAPEPMNDPKPKEYPMTITADTRHAGRRRHADGSGRQAALGCACAARAAARHGGAVPVGPRLIGLGQRLLCCCGAGGHAGLEGMAVRIA